MNLEKIFHKLGEFFALGRILDTPVGFYRGLFIYNSKPWFYERFDTGLLRIKLL